MKTNLLYDATATVNIGAEVSIAPRWSFDLSGNMNFWSFSDGKRWKHWLVQPEFRYWFCRSLGGHFLAFHGLGGQYNVGKVNLDFLDFLGSNFKEFKDYRHQGWYGLTDKLKEAGYKLDHCTTANYNKKIYTTPAGWSTAARTTDASSTDYDGTFHEVSGGKKKALPVTMPGYANENDDDGSIVYYLPELKADNDKGVLTYTPGITLYVLNDVGKTETCEMVIENSSLGAGNYKGHINNINRNHLYQFTIDKDIEEGELSYKLECWNLAQSETGWTPAAYTFDSTDTEAKEGYVCYPSYDPSNDAKKDVIQNTTSYADYSFTLSYHYGAVWKAFLVEDGVEYTAEDKFTRNADGTITYSNAANTPNGFFSE